jgi:NDP-sugar pyrophosphorylase family protein
VDLTLVIMAAGIGSRYGGTKQLVEVGPEGEAFLDFAIADAAAAGVTRTVLVVRSEIEADVRRHVEVRHRDRDLVFVRQDDHGPRRARPWGTAHAVLSARRAVDGPFIVCNADDYYGESSYSAIAAAAGEIGVDEAAMAGFRLDMTLAESGSVSRGICSVRNGRLVSVVEHKGISRDDRGVITATDPVAELDDAAIASMNLWAFSDALFDRLEEDFEGFLPGTEVDTGAEFQLPTVVSDMMAGGELSVSVIPTAEAWVGVTHPSDLEIARRRIASVRGS